jgi:putative drug exporter of the RND superfamily
MDSPTTTYARAGRVRTRRPGPPGDRFAAALRWLRWPVLIVWIFALVVLHGWSGSLSKVTNNGASAYLPATAASTKVALLQQAAEHASGQPETNAAIVVFATDHGRLTPADDAVIAAARAAVAGLAGHVSGLAAPGALQRSADGRAAAFTVNITGQASSDDIDRNAVNAIRAAVATSPSRAPTGLADAVTGPAAVNADTTSGNQQTALLLTALIIVAVILLLVYRSPILWLLPLLGAIAAIIVAQASAHGLANAGFTVSTLSADILIVLVFGAASDYALLLVHRYREELRHHDRTDAAMAATLRTTLPTLAASAATVTCAMLCLLTADSASLHGLGPVGAVGIVAALLAQATFLPALLLVVGRRAFWPRIPRQGAAGREESRLWTGIATRIARHPAATALVVIVALGAACAGLASLRIQNNPVDNVKGNQGSVVGQQLLGAHFPAGASDPLVLLAPPAQARAAAAAAHATPGVAEVVPAAPVQGYDSYTVILPADPFGPAGTTAIVGLRQRLATGAPGALVGGNPAIAYDESQTAGRDDLIIIPLVLAVTGVIIALLLQAIVAPAVLVATTVLSFAASFGLSSLVWRHGLGYAGVESVIPIYIFIFLVALGVDYNIFLSARIREESRHLGLRGGTVRGVGVTGGVITAAGIVLAGTFAALTQIPEVSITEVGTAVALGVLLDTLLVRTILVPASLLTIGERVWWPARRGTGGQDIIGIRRGEIRSVLLAGGRPRGVRGRGEQPAAPCRGWPPSPAVRRCRCSVRSGGGLRWRPGAGSGGRDGTGGRWTTGRCVSAEA